MIVSVGFLKKVTKILMVSCLALCSASAFSLDKHVVQKGETFYGISRTYGVTVDELCSANGMTKDSVLKVGDELVIPEKGKNISSSSTTSTSTASTTTTVKTDTIAAIKETEVRKYDVYVVQKGDTLYRIAKNSDTTVNDLKKINELGEDGTIKVGQELRVPSKIKTSATEEKIADLSANDPRNYSDKEVKAGIIWPVKNPTVTYTTGKVSGVQLTALKNESVTAIRAGSVRYVGYYRGYGQVVFIQAKDEQVYAYCGLGTIKVKKGDYVVFGDSIGTVGTDPIKGTNQISLMVFKKASPVDPATAPRG